MNKCRQQKNHTNLRSHSLMSLEARSKQPLVVGYPMGWRCRLHPNWAAAWLLLALSCAHLPSLPIPSIASVLGYEDSFR